MTPNQLPTDIIVPVEKIGTFRFRRRSLGVDLQTKVEFARLTQGQPVEAEVAYFMRLIADINVMIVDAPVGWPEDLESMDSYDDETFGKILAVGGALREKEQTFRPARSQVPVPGTGEGGAPGGAGDGEQLPVLVP